jgi:2-C-methyl-D-erythritol 4-phosphate cytidylyltransferase / 2-C-methyl-D-erythritol 2,4-cyclodiphosphate synthase
MPITDALIVAAGRGERAEGLVPKQYRPLGGKPALRWAVEAFVRNPEVHRVQVVIAEAEAARWREAMAGITLPAPVSGGTTRQESVRKGLEALAVSPPDRVLIHDAARPFVTSALIARVAEALGTAEAVAPMVAVSDTLRRMEDDHYALVLRQGLLRAQTPQGFVFAKILAAHRRFAGDAVTDDFALAERAGLALATVPGEELNLKLTTNDDFILAERIAAGALDDVRTGTGFDVHRFGPGDHVWLCGIRVAHDRSLEGHSDADAGLHALTDAILGALAEGDIGTHFPPTDERWRAAPSHLFLEHAASLVRARGGIIAHVDVTLICERPKISPHRDAMRTRLAEILNLEVARVSVKATSTEGLGFTGRCEGIAAQAAATLRLRA